MMLLIERVDDHFLLSTTRPPAQLLCYDLDHLLLEIRRKLENPPVGEDPSRFSCLKCGREIFASTASWDEVVGGYLCESCSMEGT